MNPARLAELERQRALVRTHLEWLDAEIAKESGAIPNSTSRPAAPASPVECASDPVASSPGPVAAEMGAAITANFTPDPISAAASARRGCFAVMCVAILLIVLVFTGLYFLRYRGRPLIFLSPENSSTGKVSPPAIPPASPRK